MGFTTSVLCSVVLSFTGNHGQTRERLGIVAGGLVVRALIARVANPDALEASEEAQDAAAVAS